MSTFEEVLDRDGRLVYRTKGRSMLPMLRQDKDLVIIEPHGARLKPMDVALYKCGSRYVLHRVIRVGDGHYLIRGDNTFSLETVPDGAVLGVLTGFQRNGREHAAEDRGYRLYARVWTALYPLRFLCVRCRRAAMEAARKLDVLPLIKKALRRG